MKTRILGLLAVALLAGPMAAHGALVTYFGENQSPAGSVSGAPATARSSFLSSLVGVGSEGFESYTAESENFTNPLAINFTGSSGNIGATLTGGGFGVVDGSYDTSGLGRFNTTAGGSNWWLAASAFTIDFSSPISAFGFFGTDIGDFTGQLTLQLTDTTDTITNLVVQNTIDGLNGSLLFFGFIDTSVSYKRITFGNTGGGFDGFGFDDMVIGDQGQIQVPEPGSLALLGLGVLGASVARRRKAS